MQVTSRYRQLCRRAVGTLLSGSCGLRTLARDAAPLRLKQDAARHLPAAAALAAVVAGGQGADWLIGYCKADSGSPVITLAPQLSLVLAWAVVTSRRSSRLHATSAQIAVYRR